MLAERLYSHDRVFGRAPYEHFFIHFNVARWCFRVEHCQSSGCRHGDPGRRAGNQVRWGPRNTSQKHTAMFFTTTTTTTATTPDTANYIVIGMAIGTTIVVLVSPMILSDKLTPDILANTAPTAIMTTTA